MTIGEWLQSREPRPPAELMVGLERALGTALAEPSDNAAAACLTAAERLLRSLVHSGETGRAIAADLLTIDALTTYAVEAATETFGNLPEFTDRAMTRFSAVLDDPTA
jgi:hypothetical protein